MTLKQLSETDFDSSISAGTTLVDFWASWCGPCKMVAPVIEELAADYEGRAAVAKLNTDENQEIAVKYGISAIPTVILFKDGAEISRLVGVQPKASYEAAINAAL